MSSLLKNIMEKFKQIWNIIFVPTSIRPIRFVLLFENILSLYRNLDYYNKMCRILIYFRITAETATTLSCVVSFSMYIYNRPVIPMGESIFFYISQISSIIITILSAYHSKTFKKLLLLIESNDTYFEHDEKYQKNMQRQNYYIKNVFVICTIILAFVSSLKYVQMDRYDPNYMIPIYVYISNGCLSTARSVYEYICLLAMLIVMTEQIECISRAVSKKRITMVTAGEQYEILSDEDCNEINVEIKEFDELSTVFSNIKDCSKLFNKVFGLQLVLMLGSSTAYCIMFLYTMAFLSVKGYPQGYYYKDLTSNVLKLLTYFVLLFLLSLAAQRKQNSVTNLRCQLGKLLIKCIQDDAQYKATKDFLRLVSSRCVKTETLGAILVDMSLIPSFIMFVTSYTVIALQFNNIV